jgi:hypothetical protein
MLGVTTIIGRTITKHSHTITLLKQSNCDKDREIEALKYQNSLLQKEIEMLFDTHIPMGK